MPPSPPSTPAHMPPSPDPSPEPSASPNPTPPPPPPKRKRRRPPPPLSVTTVFTPQRLPNSAADLWQWPVTSWFLGLLSEQDLNLAAHYPFLNPLQFAKQYPPAPRPPHYRLQWLQQDATALATDDHPSCLPPPQPLPVLPYADVKETNACARPIFPSTNPAHHPTFPSNHHHQSPLHRPAKRQRSSTSQPLPCSTPSASLQPSAVPHMSIPFSPTPHPHSNSSVTTSLLPISDHQVDAPPPQSQTLPTTGSEHPLLNRPANRSVPSDNSAMLTHVPPVPSSAINTPVDSEPEKTVVGQLVDTILDIACSGKQQEKPTEQETHFDRPAIIRSDVVKDEPHRHEQQTKYQQVCLEFQSPVEKRLMGTLTYSIPVPAHADPGDQQVKQNADDLRTDDNDEVVIVDQTQVHGLELEFRRSDLDFATGYDDKDTADELGPELLRLSSVLQATTYNMSQHRKEIFTKVQAELERQDEMAQMAAEEKQIRARLKEIADAKRAAEPTPAAKRKAPERRHSSAKKRNQSRQLQSRRRRTSRPTFKLIELDDDDDDFLGVTEPTHVNDDDVVKVVQKALVQDDGFLEIPQKPVDETPDVLSAATTPSSEPGDPSESAQSPVGIFSSESDESQLVRMPSPVSPLLAATPVKPDLTMQKPSGLVLKLRPNEVAQKSEAYG